MKISLNWIKEYTPLKLKPEDLSARLSVSLTEVERIEHFGERFTGIIVAEVKDIKAHPNSEKLLILTLNVGAKLPVQVVVQRCGVKVGDKVAYLKPGTVIPASIDEGKPVEVGKIALQGVESIGMVPSGRELGLNNDHTTVYTIDSAVNVGDLLADVLDLNDDILEIKNKSLTHRPDTFAMMGIAREIATIQRSDLQLPEWYNNPSSNKPKDLSSDRLSITVKNEAKALCKRYMVVVLDNVKVQPSPLWLQVKLAKLGIRPINNVVDISNYLMVDAGQPSHAFDYDKVVSKDPLAKGKAVIKVKLAEGGEKITTIDGQVKDLYNDTLVIADSANAPIGIAGVMGGKDTEISDSTTRVIYQVENLDMYNVRRTSMKTGIFSDAVTRFTRGLDPNLCEPVMFKAIQLLTELAGAKQASNVIDLFEEKPKEHFVTINYDEMQSWLGVDVKEKDAVDILTRLGLDVKVEPKTKALVCKIPSFRTDLRIPEDIYEEVIRIYGFDKIKPSLPKRRMAAVMEDDSTEFRNKSKEILKCLGGHELYLYSFVGKTLFDKCSLSLEKSYKLKNPLSPELSYMKPLLFPGILDKAALNMSYRANQILFEIDKVDPIKGVAEIGKDGLPYEPWHISIADTVSYYEIKAVLEGLLERLHVDDLRILPVGQTSEEIPAWITYAQNAFHPTRMGYIKVDDTVIGIIGQISPLTAKSFGLPEETSAIEINFDELLPYCSEIPAYHEPSRYPYVVHDMCFVLDKDVPYQAVVDAIRVSDSEQHEIADLGCKDIYVSGKEAEKKKITFSVTMQRSDRILNDKDVEAIRERIIESVKEKVGGELLC